MIKYKKGFTLIELLVITGLMSGSALMSAKIVKNISDAQIRAESNSEESEFKLFTSNLFRKKLICEKTIVDNNIKLGDTFNNIINENGDVILTQSANDSDFILGSNRKIILTSMKIENSSGTDAIPAGGGKGTANLIFHYKKKGTNGQLIPKENIIKMLVETDSAMKVLSCETDEFILSEWAISQACASINGTYNFTTKKCDLSCRTTNGTDEALSSDCANENFVIKAGDTMTGALKVNNASITAGTASPPNNQGMIGAERHIFAGGRIQAGLGFNGATTVPGIGNVGNGDVAAANEVLAGADIRAGNNISALNSIIASTSLCVGANCRDFTLKTCPGGQVALGVNTNGNLICGNINCASGYYLRGLDASNTPVCNKLPIDSCGVSEYISKIELNGDITCSPIPPEFNIDCGPGNVVQKIVSGVPTCLDLTQICAAGTVLQGFHHDGTAACVTKSQIVQCHDDNYLNGFHPDGTKVCYGKNHLLRGALCPDGLVLQGFDNIDGSRVCVTATPPTPTPNPSVLTDGWLCACNEEGGGSSEIRVTSCILRIDGLLADHWIPKDPYIQENRNLYGCPSSPPNPPGSEPVIQWRRN